MIVVRKANDSVCGAARLSRLVDRDPRTEYKPGSRRTELTEAWEAFTAAVYVATCMGGSRIIMQREGNVISQETIDIDILFQLCV